MLMLVSSPATGMPVTRCSGLIGVPPSNEALAPAPTQISEPLDSGKSRVHPHQPTHDPNHDDVMFIQFVFGLVKSSLTSYCTDISAARVAPAKTNIIHIDTNVFSLLSLSIAIEIDKLVPDRQTDISIS